MSVVPHGADIETGITFEAISFSPEVLQLSFSERHDRGENAVLIRTLILNAQERCPEEYEDFMVALIALVEAGQLALRNPPAKLQR